MFYEPAKNDHGLPYNPFKSCVVPRPIAWISTISPDGNINLAPFSQSNILGWDPPYVMFSAFTRFDGRRKDSVANAEETGEFRIGQVERNADHRLTRRTTPFIREITHRPELF